MARGEKYVNVPLKATSSCSLFAIGVNDEPLKNAERVAAMTNKLRNINLIICDELIS